MPKLWAMSNATLATIANGVIENGTILIRDGKIAALGEEIDLPAETVLLDMKGAWVMPGLIDAHTHISNFPEPRQRGADGIYDGNEMSSPTTPQVRALDALNPFDPAIEKVRNAGFTTCCTLPGSANIIGGTGVVYKLRGETAEEMMIPGKEQMKMALGENPKSVYGGDRHQIMTRMGNAAVLRKTLFDARDYAKRKKAAEEEGKPFEHNFILEALEPVVSGEMFVRIHAHRSDDIMTALRIGEEFNLKFSIEHCTEGYKIKDKLAETGVTCVVGPMIMEPYKQELWGVRLENAGELDAAGVKLCLTADTSSHTCYLPFHVGTLIAYGLSEETAFRALTLHPAELLGIADRTGSLEVGKDADIAVFDGYPFSNMTRCQMTVIDGEIYHDDKTDSLLKLDYML